MNKMNIEQMFLFLEENLCNTIGHPDSYEIYFEPSGEYHRIDYEPAYYSSDLERELCQQGKSKHEITVFIKDARFITRGSTLEIALASACSKVKVFLNNIRGE